MKQQTTQTKYYLLLPLLFNMFINNYANAQFNVSTYAGTIGGFADGDTSVAKFKKPFGMCIDNLGNLYVADPDNNRIRKISSDIIPIVTTIGGNGTAGYADGPAATSEFNAPSDLCVDVVGNVYVSDFGNHRIRLISADGNVYTIAGSGIEGYADGGVTEAEFDYPRGIVLDSEGNLFIGDSWNHRIRKIDMATNTVSTFAGGGDSMGVGSIGDYLDASDTTARFYTPSGLAIDADNNIYVADAYNHRIRKITPDGLVTTIAGSGPTGSGMGGFADGDAAVAILNTPTEVCVGNPGSGLLYIADTYNNRIRQLSDGYVLTIAGTGTAGYVDGTSDEAEFNYPRGIAISLSGYDHFFVCDYNNHVIRELDAFVVGIPEEINTASFELLENVDGFIKFSISSINNGKISITDITGRNIQDVNTFQTGIYTFNMSAFANGIYFATYSESGKSITRKFVLAR